MDAVENDIVILVVLSLILTCRIAINQVKIIKLTRRVDKLEKANED